jgi:hypothetical protein
VSRPKALTALVVILATGGVSAAPALASGSSGGVAGGSGGTTSGPAPQGGGANPSGGGSGTSGSQPAPPKPVPGHEPPSNPCGSGLVQANVGTPFEPFIDFTYSIANKNCPGGGLLYTETVTDVTTGTILYQDIGGESSNIVREFTVPLVVGDVYRDDLNLTDGKGNFVNSYTLTETIPSS